MALSRLTTSSFEPSISSPLNGMKNLLINGDFRVWQKGTDLNPLVTGNAVTGVDRWTNSYCDFTARLRKVEDTINGETVDTVEITKSSGTYSSCEFTQKVETQVAKYLRGQTVTFSFWVKKVGSTFGAHSCQFWLGDSETVDDTGWTNQRTYDRGRSSGVTGTNTNIAFSNNNWVKYSVTRTLSSDTNTIYCTIYTASTPTGEGVRIAKCQLEVGSKATDFERRPIALEELLCQRYFQRLDGVTLTGDAAGDLGIIHAHLWGAANPYWVHHFNTAMRTGPSFSISTSAGGLGTWYSNGQTKSFSSISLQSSNTMRAEHQGGLSSSFSSAGGSAWFRLAGNQWIAYNAEF